MNINDFTLAALKTENACFRWANRHIDDWPSMRNDAGIILYMFSLQNRENLSVNTRKAGERLDVEYKSTKKEREDLPDWQINLLLSPGKNVSNIDQYTLTGIKIRKKHLDGADAEWSSDLKDAWPVSAAIMHCWRERIFLDGNNISIHELFQKWGWEPKDYPDPIKMEKTRAEFDEFVWKGREIPSYIRYSHGWRLHPTSKQEYNAMFQEGIKELYELIKNAITKEDKNGTNTRKGSTGNSQE